MSAECPTSCDWDCDTPCHQEHLVPQKRKHDPDTCPGTLRVRAYGDEYEAFVDSVTERMKNNPDEAHGKAAYTILDCVRPDLARRVANSRIDPFYDGSRLSAFLAWLQRTMELDAILAEIDADPRFDIISDEGED